MAEGGTGQGLSLTRGQGPSLHASKNDAAYHFVTLRNRPSSTAHRRQAQTLSAALWDTGERNRLQTAADTIRHLGPPPPSFSSLSLSLLPSQANLEDLLTVCLAPRSILGLGGKETQVLILKGLKSQLVT